MCCHHRNISGFTLIELLVAISIIALLIAILMPVLGKSQDTARSAVCQSNLHQVYIGMRCYANDNDDYLPDAYTTGNFVYRQAPGNTLASDPHSIPEMFGLAAVLDRYEYMDGRSDAWVCPSQTEEMISYGNTYAFSIAKTLAKSRLFAIETQKKSAYRMVLVWDNYTLRPGLPGFRGPFSGYTIPSANRVMPHAISTPEKGSGSSKGVNNLYIGGHVKLKSDTGWY
ncbi:type II secretion system protein [Poriferisphaera sp. WC338]|uniref:type II secretion system protein n=1 Tax=Poriferisphaera sp. WC338 TaxID=3425129 RepID=UPI003D81792E